MPIRPAILNRIFYTIIGVPVLVLKAFILHADVTYSIPTKKNPTQCFLFFDQKKKERKQNNYL